MKIVKTSILFLFALFFLTSCEKNELEGFEFQIESTERKALTGEGDFVLSESAVSVIEEDKDPFALKGTEEDRKAITGEGGFVLTEGVIGGIIKEDDNDPSGPKGIGEIAVDIIKNPELAIGN